MTLSSVRLAVSKTAANSAQTALNVVAIARQTRPAAMVIAGKHARSIAAPNAGPTGSRTAANAGRTTSVRVIGR